MDKSDRILDRVCGTITRREVLAFFVLVVLTVLVLMRVQCPPTPTPTSTTSIPISTPVPFQCIGGGSEEDLVCTHPAGVTVTVSWQGVGVKVQSLPITTSLRSLGTGQGFYPVEPVVNLGIIDTSGVYTNHFEKPVKLQISYTWADVKMAAAEKLECLALGFWDGERWIAFTDSRAWDGKQWIDFTEDEADGFKGVEIQGGAFLFKRVGGTWENGCFHVWIHGNWRIPVIIAIGSKCQVHDKVTPTPVPFDCNGGIISRTTKVCVAEAAGVTVTVPWQAERGSVMVESRPLGDLGGGAETLIFTPTRQVINFEVLDAMSNTLCEFSPPIILTVTYMSTDLDQTNGNLVLAYRYWNEKGYWEGEWKLLGRGIWTDKGWDVETGKAVHFEIIGDSRGGYFRVVIGDWDGDPVIAAGRGG